MRLNGIRIPASFRFNISKRDEYVKMDYLRIIIKYGL
jgi:hypothetical protein